MRPALSLCMIVRNEERNLPACLASVRPLSPEIVIVDTGSTDATPRIAADHGASVFAFDFSFVDFAAARNHGLTRATGRWILVLDADETLDSATLPLLEPLLAGPADTGFYLERHNHACDAVTTLTTTKLDHAVRLFPNRPEYRYRGRVHETVDASILAAGGRLATTAIRIQHSFATDPESRRRRNHRYIGILKEELAAHPDDDSRLDFLAAEYHQLEMYAEATAVAERIALLRPNDARAHLFAGVYHLLYQPDLLRARADFLRALELRPGYPEALSFLHRLDETENSASQPDPPPPGATY